MTGFYFHQWRRRDSFFSPLHPVWLRSLLSLLSSG